MFSTRQPRRFNRAHIYYDERKEKLKRIEENAKRELGLLPDDDERAAEARKIALAEGLKTGMKRGIHETAIANAKNALTMGLSPEQASQITSLPLEQVLALKEELEREAAIEKWRNWRPPYIQ